MKQIIVKVQKPIVTNDPSAPWIVYNKKRDRQEAVPFEALPPAVITWMGDRHKIYCLAAWDGNHFKFYNRVSDRSW